MVDVKVKDIEHKSWGNLFTDVFYIGQKESGKRLDIQGLRAIAILLVLGTHFFPAYFPNGFVGVDVFFVVSGYVMSLVLSKHGAMNLSNTADFYIRRIKRIFPVYYLTMVIVLLTSIYFLSYTWMTSFLQKMPPSVFLYRTLFTFTQSFDKQTLVKAAAPPPTDRFTRIFNHSWSLCVEIQFYLIVPIIFFFIKNISKSRRSLVTIFTVLLATVSFSYFYWRFRIIKKPTQEVLAKVWEFAFGIFAFYHSKPRGEKSAPMSSIKCSLMVFLHTFLYVCLLIAFAPFAFSEVWFRLFVVTITAITLVTGSYSNTILLCNPPLQYIGDASYVIYMVHWPALRFIDYFAYEYGWSTTVMILLSLAATVILTLVLHHGFENRLLGMSVAFNMVLITVLVALATALTFYGPLLGRYRLGPHSDAILRNSESDAKPAHMVHRNSSGALNIAIIGDGMAVQQFHVINALLQNTSDISMELRTSMNGHPLLDTSKFIGFLTTSRPQILIIAANPTFQMLHGFFGSPQNDQVYRKMMKATKVYSRFVQRIVLVGMMPEFPSGVVSELIDRIQHPHTDRPQGVLHLPYKIFNIMSHALTMRFRSLTRVCKKCMMVDPSMAFLDRRKLKVLLFNPRTLLSYFTNRSGLTKQGQALLSRFYAKRLHGVLQRFATKTLDPASRQKNINKPAETLRKITENNNTLKAVVKADMNPTDSFEGSGAE